MSVIHRVLILKKSFISLMESKFNEQHELVFPHEDSDQLFDSKSLLRDECDLFVAEVSEASTGLGIELGWADQFDVPVICVYKEGSDPSSSLKAVAEKFIEYKKVEELIEKLGGELGY